MAEPDRAAFLWPVRVYWEDTDAGGIVFYANYLKFFERGRTEWLRQLGIEQQALRQTTGGFFVVSQTEVRYHQPARLDDLLEIGTQVLEAGRSSLLIGQHARRTHPPKLLAEATIRIAWVSGEALKPSRVPQSVLQALNIRP